MGVVVAAGGVLRHFTLGFDFLKVPVRDSFEPWTTARRIVIFPLGSDIRRTSVLYSCRLQTKDYYRSQDNNGQSTFDDLLHPTCDDDSHLSMMGQSETRGFSDIYSTNNSGLGPGSCVRVIILHQARLDWFLIPSTLA